MKRSSQLENWKAGLIVAMVLVVIAAPIVLGSHLTVAPASAQDRPDDNNRPVTFTYNAKFVCGIIDDPGIGFAGDEPSHKPGNYATDINLHNFQDRAVNVTVEPSSSNVETRKPASETITLSAGESAQLDCKQIVKQLGEIALKEQFVKGFVEIKTTQRIEVVGVYTSKATEVRDSTSSVGIDLNISTGVDETNGILISDGKDDDDWRVVSGPGVNQPRPATVVDVNLSHVQAAYPNGHRGRSPEGSKLISTDAGAFEDPPRAKFVYVRTFELPTTAKNPKLEMSFRSDDTADVYLNGDRIFNGIGSSGSATLSVDDGFVAGENRLTVVVQESGAVVTSLGVNAHVRADIAGDIGVGTGMSTDVEHIKPHVSRNVPGQDKDGNESGNSDRRGNQNDIGPGALGAASLVVAIFAMPLVMYRYRH